MPQTMSTTSSYLRIRPQQFQFESDSQSSLLRRAFQRYMKIAFLQPLPPNEPAAAVDPSAPKPHVIGNLTSLFFQIDNPNTDLRLGMDESYSLSIRATPQPVAFVHTKEIWGALRALETFSQLIDARADGFFISEAKIIDFPRFSHRGILVDTARHYLTMDTLLQHLDAMAYNKFNVLHWHIVDDQSFPFVSLTFPNMSLFGAYTQRHIYTPEDVSKVIEYARDRGIRVIPEFDTPGHASSWKSIPNLLTPCYGPNNIPNGNFGPINPIVDSNYEFLAVFFSEIKKRFPDAYVHLGGDEVSFSCWASNPDIQDFMVQKGFGKNFALLEQYYETRLLQLVEKVGLRYIIWQDVIDNKVKVNPNTVVQVWRSSPSYKSELKRVTSLNLKTILSSCWYLDLIGYGRDWEGYYRCDPQNFKGTTAEKNLVFGGEACLWGEYVDSTNFLERMWPRASAIGERLWSSAKVNNVDAALPRIDYHRCQHHIRRGIRAQPVNGYSFCQAEYNTVMRYMKKDEL
ncbi:uncharacterized protein TRIADDRAFT_36582 [Trichoplax adhaerens]|uniref:Beta-hexosaminidase n=1 Tax=Trichoplax adhaerens TaxID=10228 RepID=B3S8Y0_TRIAD|nr:hypothetical protein TRIADDRAFT_36582 [Trichoplax adhaerens]EDV20781.1 hypothetical protein TRIADDRAFT_36582 [Trichoplax adhaerens]|eukprot:XP_002116722.1 hypothetical protein TRIADDRAFT_36582 [Trichoplax adhaerens]